MMKRSSSIAALDDTIDVKLGNKPHYDEKLLVSSMMLVAIAEEDRQGRRFLRTQRSNGSIGSMSARSGCGSYGSLRGWGSNASRKSYKVDLCSLSDENSGDIANRKISTKIQKKCSTLTLQKGGANGRSSTENAELETWGFFLE
ncbi:unnamed protein product [Pseudo-nitzschia multistriata]|uniref:Uncharacterized protein n=1 Tax=Pseudo-nitzschia multistriata TaxID=183589 RepID=A0A448ZHT3_9STRA|nr:unnamed protein product [Pseudo-nitzschia multistriata]